MPEPDQRLQTVPNGYAKFLRDKDLALPKHQPYLVRWVRELVAFATEHPGYTFEFLRFLPRPGSSAQATARGSGRMGGRASRMPSVPSLGSEYRGVPGLDIALPKPGPAGKLRLPCP